MILFKRIKDLQKWLESQRSSGRQIGFVPTMGALHPGHISLINASRQDNPVTVCSIFVNPTQFNDPADFEKYPITLDKDIRLLEEAGCSVLFLPSVTEIYPDGPKARMHYDLGYLETRLEGFYRPGHFQGVCMVVHRLLDIVQPNHLYLGQKDYQQCMVITRLVELTGIKNVEVKVCPTLREADGLAMSSRNMRLSAADRQTATAIYRCLLYIKENLAAGDLSLLMQAACGQLEAAGFRVDYVDIADAHTLAPVSQWDGQQPLVALVAAFLNEVRLIDNMLLT